jgi:hypothetical protein
VKEVSAEERTPTGSQMKVNKNKEEEDSNMVIDLKEESV